MHVSDDKDDEVRIYSDYEAGYFIDYITDMSLTYDSQHLLLMVGAGLNFEKAELYYRELSMLIDRLNTDNTFFKLIFSTLSFYDQAMSAHKSGFPVYYDEFLPYKAPNNFYYNSGLFTSR